MAHSLKYPRGIIEHIAGDLNADSVLCAADVVVYGSFLEEHSFPEILIKAMSFEKPIIAPDVTMIRKYVSLHFNLLISHIMGCWLLLLSICNLNSPTIIKTFGIYNNFPASRMLSIINF